MTWFGRGVLLVALFSVLFAVVLAETEQTEALPQGCSTSGSKITLRAGGASLFLDSSSNFRVQPAPGVDKMIVQASQGGLATFTSEGTFSSQDTLLRAHTPTPQTVCVRSLSQ